MVARALPITPTKRVLLGFQTKVRGISNIFVCLSSYGSYKSVETVKVNRLCLILYFYSEMNFLTVFSLVLFSQYLVWAQNIDNKQLKCLICQAALEELDNEIDKIDPKKMIEVGGYRLDTSGTAKVKTIPQIKSEVFLSDKLDKICEKMNDYVRATWKSNGQLTLLKMVDSAGKMNSDMSRVDIIQDGDLNKSLEYYCESIVDEFEDAIIRHYKNGSDNIDIRVCSDEAKLCSHTVPESDDHLYDEL